MKRIVTLFLCMLFGFSGLFSQTTLAPGQLALIGVNCDNPDDFAFLLLADIQAGTEIKFTDNGWLASGGFRGGEGIQTYTAPYPITAGTVISFVGMAGNFTASGSFALSSTGDQLLVYQGDEVAPSLIYAVNMAGDGIWQDDATSTNTSALPAGLTNGETAVALQEFDNLIYSGSLNFPTPSAALLSISDLNNWSGDDANRFDLGSFGDFSLPVSLSSFTTAAGDEVVTLQWITESETDNAGFEIWRSVGRDSGYLCLADYRSDEGLRGQGNTNMRTVYRYEDHSVWNGQMFWYRLADVDMNGSRTFHGPISAVPHAAGGEVITTGEGNLPESFRLYPNFPNPFNPSTVIRFDIPALSEPEPRVSLSVYNVLGEQVSRLYEGRMAPGSYRLEWDAWDENGQALPAGIYYAVLKAGYYSRAVKMIYQK